MQETKDPIAVELERIVTSALPVPCSFIHANLRSANFGLDNIEGQDMPVFILVSIGKNRNKINVAGNIIRRAEIYGLLLNRKADADSIDYTSGDVNPIVNAMLELGKNLVYQVNSSPISAYSDDGEPCGVTEWQSDPIYSKFDAHLFGQGLTFTWAVNTGSNGYSKPIK